MGVAVYNHNGGMFMGQTRKKLFSCLGGNRREMGDRRWKIGGGWRVGGNALRATRNARISAALALCATLALSGAAQAALIVADNFNYSGSLTSNGWAAISGGGTAVINTGTGLDYTGLPSSGVGNSAVINPPITSGATGEDLRKAFPAGITSGTLYTSFLINLTSATSGGDYFFATHATSGGGFNGRIFAKTSGSGYVLGLTKSSTIVYDNTVRNFNTTYLVVLKVQISSTTTTDDTVSIWVNPALASSESTALLTSNSGNDITAATGFDGVVIRQGSATPAGKIDSILVGTTWADVTPAAGSGGPTIGSFSPSSGAVGASVTISGSNFGSTPTVKFNGITATLTASSATSITATVPTGATTGKITVEVTGQTTATSATDFTVVSADAPTISSITPASIYSGLGQSVTIAGSNFTGATSVTFNGVNAATYTVNSSTQITATPATSATTGPVVVTTGSGTGSSTLTVTALDSSESVVGDYSNSTNAPTSFNLGTSTKLLAGTVGGEADYVTFTVPVGYRLNGLNLKYFSYTTDQVAFVALDGGTTWSAGQTTTDMIGYSHFGTPDLNTDLLTKMNVAGSYLPAGDYTLWVQQLGAANTYVLEFELGVAPGLTLSLNPTSVAENAGANASTGTVGIPASLGSDLIVNLASTNTAAATVPASVTITAGQTSATFPIAAVANSSSYGSATTAIQASNSNYTTASATLTVTNVDAPPAPLAVKGWINEFHYDPSSNPETGEFVEIVLAPGTSNDVSLVFYNGGSSAASAAAAVTYTVTPLGGTSLAAIPFASLTAGETTSEGYRILSVVLADGSFQNGSPDGLALIIDGVVEEFVSYEGVLTASNGAAAGYTSTDCKVSETQASPGTSIQRVGPGATGRDFTWIAGATSSRGNANASQNLGATGVQGTGTLAIANSTPSSPFVTQNIFPKAAAGQTVSLTLTGTLSSGTISAMSVALPADFTGLSAGNVTVSGTGAGIPVTTLSGSTLTITGLVVNQLNPATINIAGLTTPETAGDLTKDGNYPLTVQTGVDGNLQPLLIQPIAVVTIPIAHLGVINSNGVSIHTNKVVAVEGVCTEENFNSSSSTSAFLQNGQPDGTNKVGVNVYSTLRNLFVRSNQFTVLGKVEAYNGLTEVVVTNSNNVINFGLASNQPTAVSLTIGQLTNAHEAYEGSLVRVTGLSKVSGTWATNQNLVMQAGGTNLNLRVATGSSAITEPIYPAGITGIYGQFVTNAPFVGGGVIQPRDQADIKDAPGLRLTFGEAYLYESINPPLGGTPVSGTLTVSRTGGDTSGALVVALSASPAGLVQFPASVTIPVGQEVATVTVEAIDNFGFNVAGFTNVTLTASALGSGLGDGSATVMILEDENSAPADAIKPVITLTGSATVTVAWGGTYSDAGATATDNVDTSVTVNSSGTVNTAVPGNYTITYSASDVAGNAATPVSRTVTVSAPSSTPGADGLSGLLRYAFGASGPNDTVTKPTSTVSGGNLVLTAMVRTNNAKLAVVGEAVTSLANYMNAPSITTVNGSAAGVDQAGAPAGCEKQAFTVPQGADARKFLRLKATLAP